jgi:tripartite-type tricarboxylate transporter receptor subunit TctC
LREIGVEESVAVIKIRVALRWNWVLFVCLVSVSAQAQVWPSKPIRFVVPFPAGGPTDIVARSIGHKLSEALGQAVIMDNKPGAGGAIGSDFVAKSAPDGYTILMGTTSTHSVGPALNPRLPYSVERDFIPVSHLANTTMILVVSPRAEVNSVRELIALARSKPGRLNYASSGVGTIPHLSGELFRSMAGIDIVHVPYKGVSLAIPDLLSGQVTMMFDTVATALPQIRSGKIKGLAVGGSRRSAMVPEIPTIAESGLAGFDADAYYGVFAPAGTPNEIVMRLNLELARIVHLPEVKEQLARQSTESIGSTPEQFAQVIRAEGAKWAKVIREAGVRME